MARFDVYRTRDGQLALDCQSRWLSHYNTRFAVPLMPPNASPEIAKRLNPVFEIEGELFVMVTQYAAAVPVSELGKKVCSLAEHDYRIIDAIDVLITET
jgi:toxin CcdB